MVSYVEKINREDIKSITNWTAIDDCIWKFYINDFDYFEIIRFADTFRLYILNVFGREFVTIQYTLEDCLVVAYYTYVQFFDDYYEIMESEPYETGKHLVYMHCSPDGKKYIGVTANTLEKRSHKHGTGYRFNKHMYDDIEKFGWDNFAHVILTDNLSENDAFILERELVTKHKICNPEQCYNVSFGGKGVFGVVRTEEAKRKHSESIRGEKHFRYGKYLSIEHREKIRAANTGRTISDETRRKLSEANAGEKHPMYGKHLSEETKQKLRIAHTGKTLTEEQKKKLVMSHLGKPLSKEHRQKISDSSVTKKKVLCVDTNTIYGSITEAARTTGICAQSIWKVCKGYIHTAGGYHWEYADNVRLIRKGEKYGRKSISAH